MWTVPTPTTTRFPALQAPCVRWTAWRTTTRPPRSRSRATARWSAPGLEVWLNQRGVQRLVVSGIRTEQCCETTTRHASDLGYAVDFVPEATLTFDMVQPDGRPLSAADITSRTATVLKDRFATILTVPEAVERLS